MGEFCSPQAPQMPGGRKQTRLPGDTMYVVVVYDANPHERENIRSILMPRLHWIQSSVFAGELTRVAAKDLHDSLVKQTIDAKITCWIFDRKPETFQIGVQDDRESIFL